MTVPYATQEHYGEYGAEDGAEDHRQNHSVLHGWFGLLCEGVGGWVCVCECGCVGKI